MLRHFGLATGTYREDGDDDIRLADVRITNAVRCLPPGNKPVAAEINACRPFLAAEIAAMPRLRTILTLGRLAHDATLRAAGLRPAAVPFRHAGNQLIEMQRRMIRIVSSYHCSRYHTQTGRLTDEMFADIFRMITRPGNENAN